MPRVPPPWYGYGMAPTNDWPFPDHTIGSILINGDEPPDEISLPTLDSSVHWRGCSLTPWFADVAPQMERVASLPPEEIPRTTVLKLAFLFSPAPPFEGEIS